MNLNKKNQLKKIPKKQQASQQNFMTPTIIKR